MSLSTLIHDGTNQALNINVNSITINGTGLPGASVGFQLPPDKALLVSNVTTVERLALTAENGMIVYDTTLNGFYFYSGFAWIAYDSSEIPTTLAQLSDVDITTPMAGNSLVFGANGSAPSKWANSTIFLRSLPDVNTSAAMTGYVLTYTAGLWVAQPLPPYTIEGAEDYYPVTLANGMYLVWNSTHAAWTPTTIPPPTVAIADCTDVTLSTLRQYQVLAVNGSGLWSNQTLYSFDLGDFSSSIPTMGQIPVYTGSVYTPTLISTLYLADWSMTLPTNGQFVQYVSGKYQGATINISNITGFLSSSPMNNQVLMYNTTSGNYTNQTILLNDIYGVSVPTSPTTNYVMTYIGSNWTAAATQYGSLYNLSNVVVTSPLANQYLGYSAVLNKWINLTIPAGPSPSIATCTDVLLSGLTNKQTLTYVSTASKWENTTLSLSGGYLSDVNTTGAVLANLLGFNGSQWIPGTWQAASGSLLTTAGDLFLCTSQYVLTRLPLGTSLQVLQVNTAGNAYAWQTLQTWAASSSTTLTTAGDLFLVTASGVMSRVAIGSINQVLTVTGAGTYSWQNASGGTTTLAGCTDVSISSPAQGNFLIYQSGTGKWTNEIGYTTSLSDVSSTLPTTNQFFQFVSSRWTPVTLTMSSISNVSITSPVSGQLLVYNGFSWINGNEPYSHLSNLLDCNIPTTPSNNQVLTWLSSGPAWTAVTPQTWPQLASTVLTTAGDLFIYSPTGGGMMSRLGLGSANQVLTINSGGTSYSWQNSSGGTSTLAGCTDVTISSPATGQLLIYNGTKWQNQNNPHATLASLTDVAIGLQVNGQVLTWNTSLGYWVAATPVTGSTTLAALTDCSITSPATGNYLRYLDSTTNKWQNITPSLTANNCLSDVTTSALTNGDVLVYNSGTSKFVNSQELATALTTITSLETDATLSVPVYIVTPSINGGNTCAVTYSNVVPAVPGVTDNLNATDSANPMVYINQTSQFIYPPAAMTAFASVGTWGLSGPSTFYGTTQYNYPYNILNTVTAGGYGRANFDAGQSVALYTGGNNLFFSPNSQTSYCPQYFALYGSNNAAEQTATPIVPATGTLLYMSPTYTSGSPWSVAINATAANAGPFRYFSLIISGCVFPGSPTPSYSNFYIVAAPGGLTALSLNASTLTYNRSAASLGLPILGPVSGTAITPQINLDHLADYVCYNEIFPTIPTKGYFQTAGWKVYQGVDTHEIDFVNIAHPTASFAMRYGVSQNTTLLMTQGNYSLCFFNDTSNVQNGFSIFKSSTGAQVLNVDQSGNLNIQGTLTQLWTPTTVINTVSFAGKDLEKAPEEIQAMEEENIRLEREIKMMREQVIERNKKLRLQYERLSQALSMAHDVPDNVSECSSTEHVSLRDFT